MIYCGQILRDKRPGLRPPEKLETERTKKMTNEIKIKAKTPCYINSEDNSGNPYRLTPYVAVDGVIWLAAEGNGCGDDIMLDDICCLAPEEINDKWGDIDLDAIRVAADEIAEAGENESADWLRDWAETCEKARN